mmetsp:Transcript_32034/g.51057  ORF Transcript_32034/g.51057 Transcript_32034/m.51057 type:complete len:1314 (-) Transcript_32034:3116-7057(-)
MDGSDFSQFEMGDGDHVVGDKGDELERFRDSDSDEGEVDPFCAEFDTLSCKDTSIKYETLGLEEFDIITNELKELGCISFVCHTEPTESYRPVTYSLSSAGKHSQFKDIHGPSGDLLALDCESLVESEELVSNSARHVSTIYSYRSLAKSMPVPGTEHDDEVKLVIYREIFDLLRPAICKISSVQKFHVKVSRQIKRIFESTQSAIFVDSVNWHVVQLLDSLIVLDQLKDSKPGLQNDFALYKRALHMVKDGLENFDDLRKEQDDIQFFLSNPKCSKGLMLHNLLEDIQSIRCIVNVLKKLFAWCFRRLNGPGVLLPTEKWTLLRVLPNILVLADSCKDEKGKQFDVFKGKRMLTADVCNFLKQYPVLPLIGDLHLTVRGVLEKCPHFDPALVGAFSVHPKTISGVPLAYNVLYWVDNLRSQVDDFYVQFNSMITALRAQKGAGLVPMPVRLQSKGQPHSFNDDARRVVLVGLELMTKLKQVLTANFALNLATPLSQNELASLGVESLDNPEVEYNRSVLHKLTLENRKAYIEAVGMLKTIANTIGREQQMMGRFLRASICSQIQEFLHLRLPQLINKTKKPHIKDALVCLHQLAVEWAPPPKEPVSEILCSPGKPIGEIVIPTNSQLEFLQGVLQLIIRGDVERSTSSRGFSFFTGKEYDRSQIRCISNFCEMLASVSYLTTLPETVEALSNLGELWYREFYLDITKSVQFSANTSVPWILCKTILDKNAPEFTRFLVHVLDIYNDAGNLALHSFKQQFMFNELEAELKIVLDQLLFHVREKLYSYYKSLASYKHLIANDPNGAVDAKLPKNPHLDSFVCLRLVCLLGSHVNLAAILSENLSRLVAEDIAAALRLFESDLSSLVTFSSHLKVIEETHRLLGQIDGIHVSPFENLVSDTCGERICQQVVHLFTQKLIPGYIYSDLTQCFTPRGRPKQSERQQQPVVQSYFLYGSRFGDRLDKLHQQEASYIGKKHIGAMLSMLSRTEKCCVLENICSVVETQIQALASATPINSIPALCPLNTPVDDWVKETLLTVSSYVEKQTFEILLQIGNGFALCKLIQQVVDNNDIKSFLLVGPLVGFDSSDGGRSEAFEHCCAWRVAANARNPIAETDQELLRQIAGNWADVYRKTDTFGVILGRLRYECLAVECITNLWTIAQFLLIRGQGFERYGDSILWGGCSTVYLSGAWASFRRSDLTQHVISLQRFQEPPPNGLVEAAEVVNKSSIAIFNELANALPLPSVSDACFHPPCPVRISQDTSKKTRKALHPLNRARSGPRESSLAKPEHLKRLGCSSRSIVSTGSSDSISSLENF